MLTLANLVTSMPFVNKHHHMCCLKQPKLVSSCVGDRVNHFRDLNARTQPNTFHHGFVKRVWTFFRFLLTDFKTDLVWWSHFFDVHCPTQSRNRFCTFLWSLIPLSAEVFCPFIWRYQMTSPVLLHLKSRSVCIVSSQSFIHNLKMADNQSHREAKKVKMPNGFWRPLVGPVDGTIRFLHPSWFSFSTFFYSYL